MTMRGVLRDADGEPPPPRAAAPANILPQPTNRKEYRRRWMAQSRAMKREQLGEKKFKEIQAALRRRSRKRHKRRAKVLARERKRAAAAEQQRQQEEAREKQVLVESISQRTRRRVAADTERAQSISARTRARTRQQTKKPKRRERKKMPCVLSSDLLSDTCTIHCEAGCCGCAPPRTVCQHVGRCYVSDRLCAHVVYTDSFADCAFILE